MTGDSQALLAESGVCGRWLSLRLATNTQYYCLPMNIAYISHNELLPEPRLRFSRPNLTSAWGTATTLIFPRQDTGTSWQTRVLASLSLSFGYRVSLEGLEHSMRNAGMNGMFILLITSIQ
jgi:hypothetical protein